MIIALDKELKTIEVNDSLTVIKGDRQSGKTTNLLDFWDDRNSVLFKYRYNECRQTARAFNVDLKKVMTFNDRDRLQDLYCQRILIDDFDRILNGLGERDVYNTLSYIVHYLIDNGFIVNDRIDRDKFSFFDLNIADLFCEYHFNYKKLNIEVVITGTGLLTNCGTSEFTTMLFDFLDKWT